MFWTIVVILIILVGLLCDAPEYFRQRRARREREWRRIQRNRGDGL